jgi:hypothetical protein
MDTNREDVANSQSEPQDSDASDSRTGTKRKLGHTTRVVFPERKYEDSTDWRWVTIVVTVLAALAWFALMLEKTKEALP